MSAITYKLNLYRKKTLLIEILVLVPKYFICYNYFRLQLSCRMTQAPKERAHLVAEHLNSYEAEWDMVNTVSFKRKPHTNGGMTSVWNLKLICYSINKSAEKWFHASRGEDDLVLWLICILCFYSFMFILYIMFLFLYHLFCCLGCDFIKYLFCLSY